MISFQASISKGWLHEHGGFEFTEKYYMDPIYRRLHDKEMDDFIRKDFGYYPIYNMEANLMQADNTYDNHVLIGGIQPNLILAKVLGADFVYYPDKDMDVSGNPLADISSPDILPEPAEILKHPFIQKLDVQIAWIKQKHPEFEIIPPFFWDNSGRATIHGIITTSFKLIGDQAMMMIIMDPDLLHIIHQWIADVYIVLIDYFSKQANFPVTSIHVGECSGTMISNDQYLEFITPYVSQLGRTFDNVKLHSCGHSDHILKAISEIENLSIVDTGSNTSVAKIRELVGFDFEINIEPPVKLMLEDTSEEDLVYWLKNTLEENQGGPLKIVLHLDIGYSVQNCMRIYDELLKLNDKL